MAITRSVTGVDLGRDAIKAVQVELSGAEASILNSVSIPRVRLEGQDPQSVAAALGDAMEQAGIPTNGVTLGLGGEDSILRYNHCLLYTSPSPRDATLSRMPSSA